MLISQIPIRTWAQWADATPEFVEIRRSCRTRSRKSIQIPDHSSSTVTCPRSLSNAEITFTRSQPGNSHDGCRVEQSNRAVVRTIVGYHCYDTSAELLLLNMIWVLQ